MLQTDTQGHTKSMAMLKVRILETFPSNQALCSSYCRTVCLSARFIRWTSRPTVTIKRLYKFECHLNSLGNISLVSNNNMVDKRIWGDSDRNIIYFRDRKR